MLKPCSTIAFSVLLGTLSLFQGGSPAAAQQSTALPITSITSVPPQPETQSRARVVLIVPDRDTTPSAYGGALRRYDVHVAKMFEVSNLYCGSGSVYESLEWHYFADNGNLNMGRFIMNCRLVRDIASSYGLGRPESTRITYSASNTTTTKEVPILNLTGPKVARFMDFVRGFRPIGQAQRLDRAIASNPSVPQPNQPSEPPIEPQFPISSIRFLPATQGGQARGVFIVPDRDTSQSAYGGSLSRYDAHIAKMFETAHHLYCNPDNGNWNSVEWHYFAGDGSINGGRFVMGCNLVRDIVNAYGLGRSERTRVAYTAGGAFQTANVPILNLAGNKIPRFKKFAEEFRSVGLARRIDLD